MSKSFRKETRYLAEVLTIICHSEPELCPFRTKDCPIGSGEYGKYCGKVTPDVWIEKAERRVKLDENL